MTAASWLQLVAVVAAGRRRRPAARPLPGQRLRRLGVAGRPGLRPGRAAHLPGLGIDDEREQRWNVYALSLLAFSLVSVAVPVRPPAAAGLAAAEPRRPRRVPVPLAWNTAVSFVTNTNWQNYAGENTMSQLTQMAGLAVQNFVSPVVGLCVAMALVRGLTRRRAGTVGNFWVDLVRGTLRVMLPLCVVVDARPGEPGRHPELPRLHRRPHPRGRRAGDPRRALRQPGGGQAARHQRRRHAQRQLDAPAAQHRPGSPTCSRSSRSC